MPENTSSEYLPNIPEISFSLKAFETVSPPIDETLSKPMNAADAKATGDALDETASDIADTSIALMNDYLHISPQTLTSAQKAHVKQQLGLLDLFYPVGAVYISFNSTSPATLFGGTWTKIEDTYMMAADTQHPNGTTGGSIGGARAITRNTGYTTLSAAQTGTVAHAHDHTIMMPSHSHGFEDTTEDPLASIITSTVHATIPGDTPVQNVSASGTEQTDFVNARVTGGAVRGVSGDMFIPGEVAMVQEQNASASHNHTISVTSIVLTMPTWIAVNMWRRTA